MWIALCEHYAINIRYREKNYRKGFCVICSPTFYHKVLRERIKGNIVDKNMSTSKAYSELLVSTSQSAFVLEIPKTIETIFLVYCY